ncbi:hypothetical protein RESH_05049 [Rhodopirellula europaea SH398]|uniref:Uncharacterized protein n=1 Tax=Rhodopirellula europaea SH398 TaxID=1263868 RepID=M5RYK3_9BACT|nr:hypothetical protein RESH_05049 [Rhodopirellula europaea SH398]
MFGLAIEHDDPSTNRASGSRASFERTGHQPGSSAPITTDDGA